MKSIKTIFLMFYISEFVNHFLTHKTGTDYNEKVWFHSTFSVKFHGWYVSNFKSLRQLFSN